MRDYARIPTYQLEIYPLRRHPAIASHVVKGIEDTLAGIIHDAFVLDDVTTATVEILDNIYRHADWDHPARPWFHAWYEVVGKAPYFHIASGNAVCDPVATHKYLRVVTEAQRDTQKAFSLLGQSMTVPISHQAKKNDVPSKFPATPKPGGMGLLQIASSSRCKLQTYLRDNLLDIEVEISVPEMTVE